MVDPRLSITQMSYSKEVGNWAEEYAVKYIKNQQFIIVARNYFCRGGEIDIIAKKSTQLIFFEVKYRRSMAMGGTVCSINNAKQQRLLLAAKSFLRQYPHYQRYQCRFDFIGINGMTKQKLTLQWLENIITPK